MKVNNKKGSNTRKIIPAVGMLSVSAIMLASSTYAWFTMSREVEVTGLKMTATVPEDLQISLGKLAITTAHGTAVTEATAGTYSLASSTGVLYAATAGDADNLGAADPSTNAWDWSNSADISAYYSFGRLIPASSTTGEEIYYTPDAAGVGKTVKANASYFKANDKLFARATNSADVVTADATKATNTRATLHAFTSAGDKADTEGQNATSWKTISSGGYTQAVDWKTTNDDGYYIDIPVWIRTSSNADVPISVDGYVLPGDSWANGTAEKTQTELELYRAVRVAILNGDDVNASGVADSTAGATKGTAVSATNIIPLKDAWVNRTDAGAETSVGTVAATADSTKYKAITCSNNPFLYSWPSILDSDNLLSYTTGTTTRAAALNLSTYAAGDKAGVSGLTTGTATDGSAIVPATYASYTPLTPTNNAATNATPTTVATIAGSTTAGNYGAMKKLVIRVWLDGEDKECWNDNAGQDWAISLKFSKIETSGS